MQKKKKKDTTTPNTQMDLIISVSFQILTLSFYFIRVSTPHNLPGVLLDLEGSPLRTLGFLLVKDGHHCAHLQAVKDAGTCLSPVQHPGGNDRSSSSPRGTTGGLLGTTIEAAAEPGCTHLQCIATRKPYRITDLYAVVSRWWMDPRPLKKITYRRHHSYPT